MQQRLVFAPWTRYAGPFVAARINAAEHLVFVWRKSVFGQHVLLHPLAEMNILKVLRSSHPDFVLAVKSVLPTYEFEPAIFMNRKVPQIVQMPFELCFNEGVSPVIRPDRGRFWAAPPPRPGVCP